MARQTDGAPTFLTLSGAAMLAAAAIVPFLGCGSPSAQSATPPVDGGPQDTAREASGDAGMEAVGNQPVDASAAMGPASAIAVGLSATCAILVGGRVGCWGWNEDGALGIGSKESISALTPLLVAGLSGATSIAAGGSHFCVVIAGGALACWGENSFGQIGDGTTGQGAFTNFAPSPVTVPNLSGVTAVAAGGWHTCALLSTGTVKCWGRNHFGQLGNGTMIDSATPVSVSNLSGVTAIAAGESNTCALLADHTVTCWGDNTSTELGAGFGVQGLALVVAETPATVVAISSEHSDHTCALLSDQTLTCWGSDDFGELGASPINGKPVLVPNLSGVAAVSAGGGFTCVVMADGTVRCWGSNLNGELGNGTKTPSLSPVAVSTLSGTVKSVSASITYACALLSTGGIECWGLNHVGQLGNGTKVASSVPVPVTGFL